MEPTVEWSMKGKLCKPHHQFDCEQVFWRLCDCELELIGCNAMMRCHAALIHLNQRN